jgi:hypothetical protein
MERRGVAVTLTHFFHLVAAQRQSIFNKLDAEKAQKGTLAHQIENHFRGDEP